MKNTINKYTLALLLVFFGGSLFAQHTIHFSVKNNASSHRADTVFIAGNFNNWNPAATAMVYSEANKKWELTLQNIREKQLEFKFTRGSWPSVEAGLNGAEVGNHIVQLSADTSLTFNIDYWRDDFAVAEKKHTASPNVSIVDSAFYIPQLNTKRRIWVYLPEGYSNSKKHYPVLYMHDGQNLFDEFTAGFGEWGVDECLDSLQKQQKKACIVIGIDNGPERLREYNPFDNDKYGKEEGVEYTEFLVNTLKPYIDHHYRTLTQASNTMIAGSSMGGLISYYAALKYPDVFGKAGIFSPSFWIAPQMLALTDSLSSKLNSKLFFYMGGMEGENALQDMKNITDKLAENSQTLIYAKTDPDGSHNEQAWRKWFPEFYKWMMSDWTNYVIDPED